MPNVKILKGLLGKKAPRLDHRTLKLSNYLTPALAAPPTRSGYLQKVAKWPMYLNDQLGDCVIAAAAHMIQQWTTYAGREVRITDSDVMLGYEQVGGYSPNDPSTDNGCDMLTALRYWRKVGFGGHRIAAYVSVNLKNPAEVAQAIYLFGGVYAGVALPVSAQEPTQTGQYPCWSVPHYGLNGDGSPGSWGGHCIPLFGYSLDKAGNPGTMLVSWGELYDMTWKFLRAYGDECWAVLSLDWFNKVGVAPNGFNLTQLAADLRKL
jgi:hypothetical protein